MGDTVAAMLSTGPGTTSWQGMVLAAVIAIGGWGLSEVQAARHLPRGIREAMIGSTTLFIVGGTVLGVRGASTGWVGAGAAGAFYGGMLVGLKGRLDLLVDAEHLPAPPAGQALAPRRQLQACGLGFLAFVLYYALYGDALFPSA